MRKLLAICFIFVFCWIVGPSTQRSPLALGPDSIFAQGKTCPDVVKAALAATSKDCATTGRNKMCYGNNSIQAAAQADVSDFTFAAPGNIVDVAKVQKLTLGALSTDDKTWGIVLMRIQANLPDTANGQNVTMLLFGDVGITSDALAAGLVAATPEATQSAAAAPAATASAAASKPMQAFYFRTGVGDPACNEAPRDGILLQSPKGSKTKVTLIADGVQLELGSTAFLQAHPGGEMTASTLEGSVAVTAFGKTETAAAGTRVRVPLDANLEASGPPSAPEPYDYGTMLPLPVKNLPVVVKILAPKPPANAATSNWNATLTITSVTGGPCTKDSGSAAATLQTDASGKTMWVGNANGMFILTSTGTDTFSGVAVNAQETTYLTIHFTSQTHAEGEGTITGICSGTIHFAIDKVGS